MDNADRRKEDRRKSDRRESKVEEIVVKEGETLFKQGDAGHSAYILKSGSIEIFKTNNNGDKQTISVLKGMTVIGEMSLIEKSTHSVTAMTLEECRLTEITEDSIDNLCKYKPQGLIFILKIVIKRLRATMSEVSKLEQLIKEKDAKIQKRKKKKK